MWILIALAAGGTLFWIAGPFSLQTFLGMRRDDRMDLRAREDGILDEYSPPGLPDR